MSKEAVKERVVFKAEQKDRNVNFGGKTVLLPAGASIKEVRGGTARKFFIQQGDKRSNPQDPSSFNAASSIKEVTGESAEARGGLEVQAPPRKRERKGDIDRLVNTVKRKDGTVVKNFESGRTTITKTERITTPVEVTKTKTEEVTTTNLVTTPIKENKKKFGGFDLSEAPPIKTSIFDLSSKAANEGKVTKAVLLGTTASGFEFVKGTASGFISIFNPKTYVNLIKSISNPKETREGFTQLGTEIKTNPTKIFRIGGEFLGASKGISTIQKGVTALNKPTIVSTGSESIATRTGDLGSVTVTQGTTRVKVGGKTFNVDTVSKGFAVNSKDGSSLQAVITKSGAKTGKITATRQSAGLQLNKPDSTASFESFKTTIGKVSKTGESRSISKVIIDDGFKTTVGATASKVKGKPEAISTSVIKETAKIDDVLFSKGKTTSLIGKESLKKFDSQFDRTITTPKKSNFDLSASGEKLTFDTTTGTSQIGGTTQLAKQVAKTAAIAKAGTSKGNLLIGGITLIPESKNIENTVLSKPKTKQEIKTTAVTTTSLKSSTNTRVGNIFSTKSSTKTIQGSSTRQGQITELITTQETTQQPKQTTITNLITTQRTIPTRIITTKLIPIKTPPPPTTTTKTPPFVSPKKNKNKSSFSALVRRRGSFFELGKFKTKAQATRSASIFVDRTSSASFKIKSKGVDVDPSFNILSPSKFRRSKKDKKVIVERRGKRISTLGEFGEITVKGIRTRRKKFL